MKQFRVLSLTAGVTSARWEQLLNDAAAEGYEWVDMAEFGGDGRVVMQRDTPVDPPPPRRGARWVYPVNK